jgi:hypothetical protein
VWVLYHTAAKQVWCAPVPVTGAVTAGTGTVWNFPTCRLPVPNPTRKRYYARFRSITLNNRESHFSQSKLKLYGLFRAFRLLKLYLIGVRNLIVEVDTRYIKGMLWNPDLQPSASIKWWILAILTFHFILVHIPSTMHGPDGMSRRRPQPGDKPEPDNDFDNWINNLYGFMHFINEAIIHSDQSTSIYIFISVATNAPTTSQDQGNISYDEVPWLPKAKHADDRLSLVTNWLETLARPSDMSDNDYTVFIHYSMYFFIQANKPWRKDLQGCRQVFTISHTPSGAWRRRTQRFLCD